MREIGSKSDVVISQSVDYVPYCILIGLHADGALLLKYSVGFSVRAVA